MILTGIFTRLWTLWRGLRTGGAREVWEIQALMYERGARCATATGALCETPREWRGAEAATREDFVGDVLTLVARDFGGAVFSFSAPESSQGLTDSGWDVRAEGDEGRQMVLARMRAREAGDFSASFSVVARTAEGAKARAYRVSACFETDAEVGGMCIPRTGNFEGISQREMCGAFMGRVEEVSGGAVCKGLDRRGTFCILDSAEVFPCRGLFKTGRVCNVEYNRPVLNAGVCGGRCAPGFAALGGRCCLREGLGVGVCVEGEER